MNYLVETGCEIIKNKFYTKTSIFLKYLIINKNIEND